jgi:hypothetical protein
MRVCSYCCKAHGPSQYGPTSVSPREEDTAQALGQKAVQPNFLELWRDQCLRSAHFPEKANYF